MNDKVREFLKSEGERISKTPFKSAVIADIEHTCDAINKATDGKGITSMKQKIRIVK